MRLIRHTLFLLFTVVILSGCSIQGDRTPSAQSDIQEPAVSLKVCYSGASAPQAVSWYAHDMGIFEKYGLDVELFSIDGGSRAATALIAGEMDFCQMAGSAVVNAVASGEDLVFIGGLYNVFLYSLMVRPEIETPEDLRGAVLATTGPGGLSEAATIYAVETLGLNPDEDISLLAVGTETLRMAALENGDIDGTVMFLPTTAIARQQGFRELLNLSELDQPYQRLGIVTTRAFIDENEEVVEGFIKAIGETIAEMKKDPEGTQEAMSRYMLLNEDEQNSSFLTTDMPSSVDLCQQCERGKG